MNPTTTPTTDPSEIETTEYIRPVAGPDTDARADMLADARTDADSVNDQRAGLAANWLVSLTRGIEAATDDLNAAIRAGARLPIRIADRVVLDAGDGGFHVVTATEYRRMIGNATGGGL